MSGNETRRWALCFLLVLAACSSKGDLTRATDAGDDRAKGSGGSGTGSGGNEPGTGGQGIAGSGSGGVSGTGGRASGTGGAGTGGGVGTGSGGRGDGSGGAAASGGAGGSISGSGGGGGGVPPVICSLVTTLADCEARTDCHSVFRDPHNCSCAALGCCAQFNRCADGNQAICTAGTGMVCAAATPYCEGPYVVGYTPTCFDGCVQSKDCAPTGSIACGAAACSLQQACVHPARGGTCLMPDAGQCPAGTSAAGVPACCLPPDKPTCVTIDRACSGTSVTCACFSVDPCDPHLTNACASSTIQGRDIQCRAG